jgi:DNA repair protein RadA/Sms
MPKVHTRFVCQNCGRQTPRYMGRCPSCNEFNTMVEEVVEPSRPASNSRNASRSPYALRTQAQRLTEINTQEMPRLRVPIGEFNRVLGGGIVPGSIVLIGGEPGIGKCVVGDTLIPTDQGLIPLEQLKPDTALEGFTPLSVGVQSVDGLRQTSHFYDSGLQPTKRIQTRMGYELQGTYTHPVLTLAPDGMMCWKNLEDVQPGDRVAIQRHGAVWGNETAFAELPTPLDTELAYTLGLRADGHVPTCILRSTRENARAFLQGLFEASAGKRLIEYRAASQTLARQVHLLLLQFGMIAKLGFIPDEGAWSITLRGENARLFYERIGYRLERALAVPNMSRHSESVEQHDFSEPEFYWDAVVAAEDGGIAHCYDLTVPETHAFVANGIASHNSTLNLQMAAMMANAGMRVLYVSGEESAQQIKMRADRLELHASELFLVTETNLAVILEQVNQVDPSVLIIDSIQTIYTEESESSPGSVSQVRECASRLQMLAKTGGVSVFLIGHVTKEGAIAGPRVLEHIVDTVLYLEGDPFQAYRLLRSVKNRFGATSEVGVFEMSGGGMVEVPNPSEAFLAERVANSPGTAVAVTMEGTRPLLVEIQALTSITAFGNPRRTPNGVDINRLLLISAVLTKRMGLKLFEQDIFVNVVGGMKVDEPASDMAMAIAIASSYYDKPIPNDLAIIGEVGLSGELRAVSQLPARLSEAAKLGFKRVLIPRLRRKLADLPEGLKVHEARNIGEALAIAVPKD